MKSTFALGIAYVLVAGSIAISLWSGQNLRQRIEALEARCVDRTESAPVATTPPAAYPSGNVAEPSPPDDQARSEEITYDGFHRIWAEHGDHKALRNCWKEAPTVQFLHYRITVAATGEVTGAVPDQVRLSPENQRLASCVAGLVEAVRFPAGGARTGRVQINRPAGR